MNIIYIISYLIGIIGTLLFCDFIIIFYAEKNTKKIYGLKKKKTINDEEEELYLEEELKDLNEQLL